ncbi:MAG TPA: hypothetical protein VKU85_21530, partial [bacterium]|nr:hypothetical protein [bacterium]
METSRKDRGATKWALACGSLLAYGLVLAVHPVFRAIRKFQFLELTEWTKASLWRPPRHGLAHVWHYLQDHPHERAWLFVVILAVLFLLYAWSLRCARRGAGFSPTATALWTVALGAPLVAALPVLSNDIFAYILTGEIADHGLNPYAVDLVDQKWSEASPYLLRIEHGNLYGPMVTRLFQILHFDGPTLFQKLLVFKAFLVLTLVACSLLLAGALRALGHPEKAVSTGVLAFAFSPLILIEVAMNGHLDVVVALLVTGGLFLLSRGHGFWGLAVTASAVAVKAVCLLMAPALLVFAYFGAGGGRPGILRAVGLAAWTAGAYFVWLIPDWTGSNPLGPLSDVDHLSCNSLTYALQLAARASEVRPSDVQWLGRSLFAILLLWGVWNVRTTERLIARLSRDWLLFLLYFVPWLHPWYLIPAFAPALLSHRKRDWVTLSVFSAMFLVANYVFVIGGMLKTRDSWLWSYIFGVLPAGVLFLVLSFR